MKYILLNDDTWGWWNWRFSEFCFFPPLPKATEPDRGVFWWTSVALRFVATLNVEMKVRKIIHHIVVLIRIPLKEYLKGIHQQLGLQLPNVKSVITVGVHIRRGDKGNVAKPFVTEEYFEAMLRFVRDLSYDRPRYGLEEVSYNDVRSM